MQEGRPSLTAQRVAIRRAAHQLLDIPPVFEDPLAMKIIGPEAAAKLREEGRRSVEGSKISRALRAFLAGRSRYAEDELAVSIKRGARQYVVLGAGLDTFAYRNPYSNLRVFEVDHSATQAWKLKRLEESGISLPPSLTFAPIDFERQALSDSLMRAGFDSRQPAFFSWLGVTPYLPRSAVFETLRTIASFADQCGIVFDYAIPRSSLSFVHRMALDAVAARVAAAGEPFQGFFEPRELNVFLNEIGFLHVEDLDASAINQRYFQDRADGFRVAGEAGHLLSVYK